ncbi:hypothetical protein BDD12DRAFT_814954 [Trichophaea hybrida]|nr:hypothetical protein BDD12DRAFT_814954 [Trichophaea hybrida]
MAQDHEGSTIRGLITSGFQGMFRREPEVLSDDELEQDITDDPRYGRNSRRNTHRSERNSTRMNNQSIAPTEAANHAWEATGETSHDRERKDQRSSEKTQDLRPESEQKPGTGTNLQQSLCQESDESSSLRKTLPKTPPEKSTDQEKSTKQDLQGATHDETHGEKPTSESSREPNKDHKDLKAHENTCGRIRKQPTDRSLESQNAKLTKELRRWHEGYRKLESQKNQLEGKCKKLESVVLGLREFQEEENAKAILAMDERTAERDQLKSKLKELQASHIRSVNSVGTGLEYISDQTFKDNLRGLHDKVGDWCRKAFKRKGQIRGLEEIDDLRIRAFLATRVCDTRDMSVGNLIETVSWGYIEKSILSAWFPAMSSENLHHVSALEDDIRVGDGTSSSLEKAEFWRAYTASLLFQNRQYEANLKDVSPQSADLYEIFGKVLRDSPSISRNYTILLQEILRSVMLLAARLRCQRGVYEVDESAQVGDRYNDETMIEIKNPDIEDHATVSCIISRGLVKRSYKGATEVLELICKARVLVMVERE